MTLLASLLTGMIVVTVSNIHPTIADSSLPNENCEQNSRCYLMSLLTEEQKEILFNKMQELWESDASWKVIRIEMRETLKDILTEEQKDALELKRQEFKDKRKGIRGELRETLEDVLTEEQTKTLFDKKQELWESGACYVEIRREMRKTLKNLLTEEQKETLLGKIQELTECNAKNE